MIVCSESSIEFNGLIAELVRTGTRNLEVLGSKPPGECFVIEFVEVVGSKRLSIKFMKDSIDR